VQRIGLKCKPRENNCLFRGEQGVMGRTPMGEERPMLPPKIAALYGEMEKVREERRIPPCPG
jgi:hypothetical protein